MEERRSKIGPLIQEKMARMARRDPFYWLTSATLTKDEQPQDGENPYRPFPMLYYIQLMLRFMLDFQIEQGFIYKSRTMMATWTATGAYTWYAAEKAATKVVFQSQDEERALHAVKNCKILWENSIPRLREKWALKRPLEQQAQNKLEFANGSEIIGIVGDANKIKSEHPTIYCQDESAIMVDGEQALNEAAAARVHKSTCISSAYPGWYADRFESSKPIPYIHNPNMAFIGSLVEGMTDGPYFAGGEQQDPSFATHGIRMYKTPNSLGGNIFLDVDIEADPEFRNPEALAKLERRFQPKAFFLREIRRKAYALSGATIYPEFSRDLHVVPHSSIPKRGTLFMSLDPHPRTPHAAIWILIDGYGDWWVYRELWPSKVYATNKKLTDSDEENRYTIKEYAGAIAELEGNKIEWHEEETDREYGIVQEKKEVIYCRFMDQAGKGFMAHTSETQTEAYSTRYNRYGFQFRDPRKSHEAGEDAIHELLKKRKHDTRGDWPRLHISDRCPELILEFEKTKYKQMKRLDPDKELHQSSVEYRTHMLDNLRYIATSDADFYPDCVSERNLV